VVDKVLKDSRWSRAEAVVEYVRLEGVKEGGRSERTPLNRLVVLAEQQLTESMAHDYAKKGRQGHGTLRFGQAGHRGRLPCPHFTQLALGRLLGEHLIHKSVQNLE